MKTDLEAVRFLMSLASAGTVIPEVVGRELPDHDIIINDQVITRADIVKRNEETVQRLHKKAAGFYTPGQELSKEERDGIRNFLFTSSRAIDEHWRDDLLNQYDNVEKLLERIRVRDGLPEGDNKQPEKQGAGAFSYKIGKKKRQSLKPKDKSEDLSHKQPDGDLAYVAPDKKDSVVPDSHAKAHRFIEMQPDEELKKHAKAYLAMLVHKGSAVAPYDAYQDIFHSSAEKSGITVNDVASQETRKELEAFFNNDFALKKILSSVQKNIERYENPETGQQTGAGRG